MARTGRPPKPQEAKRREGTLRPDRDKATPLLIGGRGAPEPSAFLNPLQRERFLDLVDELRAAGILDTADRGMVELAAVEEAELVECNAHIAMHGRTIEGAHGGMAANPCVSMRSKSMNHLRQLYAELGIGPASRARFQNLGIKPTEPQKHLAGIGGKPVSLDEARALRAGK